jgi:hypothetical protein
MAHNKKDWCALTNQSEKNLHIQDFVLLADSVTVLKNRKDRVPYIIIMDPDQLEVQKSQIRADADLQHKYLSSRQADQHRLKTIISIQ